MVQITDAAMKKIKKELKKNRNPMTKPYVRLNVEYG